MLLNQFWFQVVNFSVESSLSLASQNKNLLGFLLSSLKFLLNLGIEWSQVRLVGSSLLKA
jgi:hypothetical protein